MTSIASQILDKAPRGSRGVSLLLAAGVLVAMLGASGCNEGPRIVGAQREAEEQVDRARKYAKEREVVHRQVIRTEREMHPRLRLARHPSSDCDVEYAPIRPRDGIEPIACGNFAGVWPLTVTRGYLRYEPSVVTGFHRVIFTAPGGSEYAVNTSIRDPGQLRIAEIAKRSRGGKLVDLKALLKHGLGLCGNLGEAGAPPDNRGFGSGP